ncbi:hypothetical protein BC826DRAFT_1018213, partial [Russula brevipes]
MNIDRAAATGLGSCAIELSTSFTVAPDGTRTILLTLRLPFLASLFLLSDGRPRRTAVIIQINRRGRSLLAWRTGSGGRHRGGNADLTDVIKAQHGLGCPAQSTHVIVRVRRFLTDGAAIAIGSGLWRWVFRGVFRLWTITVCCGSCLCLCWCCRSLACLIRIHSFRGHCLGILLGRNRGLLGGQGRLLGHCSIFFRTSGGGVEASGGGGTVAIGSLLGSDSPTAF